MTNQEWRVLDGEGNEQGPYSFQDLQGYYTTGNISHETMIWTEGLDQWVPAGQVQGLLPDEIPIVPLAAAAPTHAAPPAQTAPVGGINLSPQVSVSNSSPLAAGGKKGAPAWLSITTIAIGVTCLILFFFPWVSASLDVSETDDQKFTKLLTQSGFESITADQTVTDEFMELMAEQLAAFNGGDKEAARKKLKEEIEDNDEKPYGKSTLNLIGMICIGIAVILCLIVCSIRSQP